VKSHMYAVILAGGQGKRFWPISTAAHPKQLLNLLGEKTLLEMAVERVMDIIPLENILVLTNRSLVDASRLAAPSLPPENIIGEPMGRDTAPAVALSCLLVEHRDPEGVFCILTADQVMENLPLFRKTLIEAAEIASREELIVTIGINPAEPSTSFGYIETDGVYEKRDNVEFFKVKRFVEKPNIDKAREYVANGGYLWNAGMFIWSANTVRNGLNRYTPHLVEMMDRLAPHIETDNFIEHIRIEYERLEKISIDYALMEKADNIVVARGMFAWSDLGSWSAVADHLDEDVNGNVTIGDVQSIDSHGNIVVSKNRLTALIGINDLVVIQADGVTLVCPKDRAQDIKEMVRKLTDDGGYGGVL